MTIYMFRIITIERRLTQKVLYLERGNMACWLYQGAKRFNNFYTEMSDEMKISLQAFENHRREV